MSLLYALTPAGSNSAARTCDCLAHRFENAGDRPYRRPRYPSDMTDAKWAVVRDAMPVPAWLEGRGGQPEGYCHRQMVDAVRYLVAGGITWRAMPDDFPEWDRVYAFFRRWRDTGLVAEFHDRLRDRVREAAGRDPEPTAGIIDAQSVKAASSVPGVESPARAQHCRSESFAPLRHHRTGRRRGDPLRPLIGRHDRRPLFAAARKGQHLGHRLTGDHESLPHSLRLTQLGLEGFHPLPSSAFTLLQQPDHRRHPAPPPKRQHDTSSLPPKHQPYA
ncbi:transposase [Kitasatospora aureofaciens]|uniref:transposase n=1 Tax=Kitasatospora aureofaciens TaxID=1894 RepID=UPI0036F47E64